MRYIFRLSAFSLILTPASRSVLAVSRVTARTTSSVRPWRTRLLASEDDGSGVRSDGALKGFFRDMPCLNDKFSIFVGERNRKGLRMMSPY
jgi:hypothetical protein